MVAFVGQHPAEARQFFADPQNRRAEPIEIQRIQIPPLQYSALVSTEPVEGPLHCSIRNEVPFSTGKEYTFLDLGVGIDCRAVKEVAGQLSLYVLADISSALQEPTPSSGLPPTVRQNKWSSTVLVPFKKPTVVFSSDDIASKRQMQLELTATPIT